MTAAQTPNCRNHSALSPAPKARSCLWVPWHLPQLPLLVLPPTSQNLCGPAGPALPLSAQPPPVSRWGSAALPPRKYWVPEHPQTAVCFLTLWLGCYGLPQSMLSTCSITEPYPQPPSIIHFSQDMNSFSVPTDPSSQGRTNYFYSSVVIDTSQTHLAPAWTLRLTHYRNCLSPLQSGLPTREQNAIRMT